MTRANSAFYVAIFGLPKDVSDSIQGGVTRFNTKAELNAWIGESKAIVHPKFPNYGILPDGRAVQIFHGHTENLITKVEIG